MSKEQHDLLNPTAKDLSMGALMQDTIGLSAKKKIAKRRQDIITGNIASHSRVLNNDNALKHAIEYNKLAVSLSIVEEETEAKRKAQMEKRKSEQLEKLKRKQQRINKENEKKKNSWRA